MSLCVCLYVTQREGEWKWEKLKSYTWYKYKISTKNRCKRHKFLNHRVLCKGWHTLRNEHASCNIYWSHPLLSPRMPFPRFSAGHACQRFLLAEYAYTYFTNTTRCMCVHDLHGAICYSLAARDRCHAGGQSQTILSLDSFSAPKIFFTLSKSLHIFESLLFYLWNGQLIFPAHGLDIKPKKTSVRKGHNTVPTYHRANSQQMVGIICSSPLIFKAY